MKYFGWYRSLLLVICVSSPAVAAWQQATIGALLDSVMTTSQHLTHLTAKMERTIVTNGDSLSTIGSFTYYAPDSLRLTYLVPEKQDILITAEQFLLYPVSQGAALILKRDSLSFFEKEFIQQSIMVKINHIKQMYEGYRFTYIGTYADDIVISATPKTGWKKLSKILIKIDPQTFCYRAFEIFDASGTLIHQIRYHAYTQQKGVWFPQQININTVSGSTLVKEHMVFTRLKINQVGSVNAFKFELPAETRIISTLQGE